MIYPPTRFRSLTCAVSIWTHGHRTKDVSAWYWTILMRVLFLFHAMLMIELIKETRVRIMPTPCRSGGGYAHVFFFDRLNINSITGFGRNRRSSPWMFGDSSERSGGRRMLRRSVRGSVHSSEREVVRGMKTCIDNDNRDVYHALRVYFQRAITMQKYQR